MFVQTSYLMLKCCELCFKMWNVTRMPAIPTSSQRHTENLGQTCKISKKVKGIRTGKQNMKLYDLRLI